MNSTNLLIEFRQVNLVFGNKKVFHNFNWKINPLDKIVITGQSGIGKTTIFNLILGFVKPQSGSVLFHNQPINSKNIWQIRQQTAYVDQDTTLGFTTGKQLLKEILTFQANHHLQISPNKLNSVLQKFNLLPQTITKPINQLSGGERQRLGLAIAILLKRPLLLLDEITASLDQTNKTLVANYLNQLEQTTILVISHDKVWAQQTNFKKFTFPSKQI